jgi:NAD(P)-dependent dehydrogenase (short-subunit alcohol dehydrogenase family)
VGKILIGQKRGHIINFTSNAGSHGIPNNAAYGPAKAGVIGLTRVLAVEWEPYGVTTNAVAPGFARTSINAEILAQPNLVERFLTRMPLGEILPDDVAVGPTLFLASEAARWINGHTLYVDAGFNIA